MSAFFISSRRRHTRCLSDWSSDVCSSDLSGGSDEAPPQGEPELLRSLQWLVSPESSKSGGDEETPPGDAELLRSLQGKKRSEERRVGKECRCRMTTFIG